MDSRLLQILCPITELLENYDLAGIDLPTRVSKCGVEMVNLSASFLTHRGGNLPRVRQMPPSAMIYQECSCSAMAAPLPIGPFGRYVSLLPFC